MNWQELSFVCERELAEILSEELSERGALSVTMADARDQPVFEPPRGTTPLWTLTRVSALFDAGHDLGAEVGALQATLDPRPVPAHEIRDIQDEDWVRAGQAGFGAARFGERLWVVPSWSEPPPEAQAVVRLDPGLAFGTGSHPTTALCLEWLDAVVSPAAQVCDYGCGSGVLSVAALALGAGQVLAVDTDPQAIGATCANAQANGVADRVQAVLPDAVGGAQFDVVVANILSGPLIELAPRLASLCQDGARLALSGLLVEQADTIVPAYAPWFELERRAVRDDWARLDFIKRNA